MRRLTMRSTLLRAAGRVGDPVTGATSHRTVLVLFTYGSSDSMVSGYPSSMVWRHKATWDLTQAKFRLLGCENCLANTASFPEFRQ
jgi:hypothetical protein